MIDIAKHLLNSAPTLGDRTLIAIDGRGGSGKTALANLLSKKLDATVIHTDDFAGQNNQEDWHQSIISNILKPIARGERTLNYERISWWNGHNPQPVRNQSATAVLFLEGVSALRDEFRPFISFAIFVDTPADICRARGLERDKSQTKTRNELSALWGRWAAEEEAYFGRDNPMEFANLVVDGAAPFNLR
jgi:uridine kinase